MKNSKSKTPFASQAFHQGDRDKAPIPMKQDKNKAPIVKAPANV